MSNRAVINPHEPEGGGGWLDAYMPEGQLGPYQPPKSRLIDMATIRGILFRQRWLLASVILLALVGGLVFTILATPIYSAKATVKVEPYGAYIVEGQNIDQGYNSNQIGSYMETQAEVIRSRNLAQVVVDELNLAERSDLLGNDIDEARPAGVSNEEWLEAKRARAASLLQRGVTAEVAEVSWIIDIGYRSDNRLLTAEVANAYANAFVATDSRETLNQNAYALEYLRSEIEKVRSRLEEAEQAANTYARNAGIILQPTAGSGEEEATGTTLTAANLASINSRVASARARRIEAEQRWRSVENVPASQLPEVQSSATLQGLISQRTEKQAELVELRQRYNDDFPQIENLTTQIAALDRQIEATSRDIKATIRNDFVIARNQEQALERELAELTGATLEEQDRQVQFGVLEREAQALRQQLNALLERYNQISSAANVQTGKITKLDDATVPNVPVAPSLTQNMIVALVFGIALAAGLAVLRETLDDRIRSLEQVEEIIGLPLLGHTPLIGEDDIKTEGSDAFSVLMESYASIRSTIDFGLPRESNVIQFTSSQAGEGKSTTAIILAELFANMGRKVLLVDADLRRPALLKMLELGSASAGLVEVLLGHTDLESATIKGVHENLEILPVGELPPNPTELLSSNQLREFIAKYRQEYSLIIFDSSPVLGLADAPVLSRSCDATVFVLEANKIKFGQAKSSLRRIRDAGGKPLGIVLTKYNALKAGQDYNYQYRYYRYGGSSGAA